jgi:hypothetical protein
LKVKFYRHFYNLYKRLPKILENTHKINKGNPMGLNFSTNMVEEVYIPFINKFQYS